MKIWVYLNGIQQGPYTLEELSRLPVTATTPVWYEGLPQWLPAGEAPETSSLFGPAPAVAEPSADLNTLVADYPPTRAADAPPCPPTYVGWSIFVLICCFPIGGILGLVFSSLSGSAYREGNYSKAAKLSEYAEWTIILSIVIGLVMAPLAAILM